MDNLNLNLLFGAATGLIMISLAGFMLIDSGFNRVKNSGNSAIRNLVGLAGSGLAFILIGFGLMHGDLNAWFGWIDLGTQAAYPSIASAQIGFELLVCAFAARIFLSATTERMKLPASLIFVSLFAAVIYPMAGKWAGASGWLSHLGFQDESGASFIHLAGSVAALIGTNLVGSRNGKYGSDGQSRVILGSSVTYSILGVFMIWTGWSAFSLKNLATGDLAVQAFSQTGLNYLLATMAATLASMQVAWFKYKKPDITLILNGTLTGLVALSACGSSLTRFGSIAVGLLAGSSVVASIELIDKKYRIDDPAGAISVHGVGGVIGLLARGLFSISPNEAGIPQGIFYGGSLRSLLIQLAGILVTVVWSGLISFLILKVIDKTIGLRVEKVVEINGLDLEIHGLASAQNESLLSSDSLLAVGGSFDHLANDRASEVQLERLVNEAESFPIPLRPDGSPRMTLISMIIRQNKFEPLKSALNAIGVTGMTVTQVAGCGMQKGDKEYYRGIPVDIQLLPKVKVEVVVCKVPVDLVVQTVRKVLYTGYIGDGKLFISEIDRVLKVRTGEEDFDALQDAIN